MVSRYQAFYLAKEAKLGIARELAEAGIDAIEVGFPASGKSEFESAHSIAKSVNGPFIVALCRANEKDIRLAFEAIGYNQKPVLYIFIATSDIHVNAKFASHGEDLKARRQWVFEQAVKSIRFAVSLSHHLTIQFTPEDTTRTEEGFLIEIIQASITAGASIINLADTVGVAGENEMANLIAMVKTHVRNIHEAEISVHCHNDHGLATANTLAAIAAGIDQIEVTLSGIGERAGNCALEQVIARLTSRPQYYRVNFHLTHPESAPSQI